MKPEVSKFFANNPDATECFEALGVVKGSREEAEALLGGVKDATVTTWIREGEPIAPFSGYVSVEEIQESISKKEAEIEALEKAENEARAQYESVKSIEDKKAWEAAQEALNQAYAELEQLQKEAGK